MKAKKLLCIILAFVMIAAYAPFSAFAADCTHENTVTLAYGLPSTEGYRTGESVFAGMEYCPACNMINTGIDWTEADTDTLFPPATCTHEFTEVIFSDTRLEDTYTLNSELFGGIFENTVFWYCPICGELYMIMSYEGVEIITNATAMADYISYPSNMQCPHTMVVKFDREEPTCGRSGNTDYWYCYTCNSYFTDEACTHMLTEENIDEIILPATGEHDYSKTAIDGATGEEYIYCSVCGQRFRCEHANMYELNETFSYTKYYLAPIGSYSEYFAQHDIGVAYCPDCEKFIYHWDGSVYENNPGISYFDYLDKRIISPGVALCQHTHKEELTNEPSCTKYYYTSSSNYNFRHNYGYNWYYCPDCQKYVYYEDGVEKYGEDITQIYYFNEFSAPLNHVNEVPLYYGETCMGYSILPDFDLGPNSEWYYCPDCGQTRHVTIGVANDIYPPNKGPVVTPPAAHEYQDGKCIHCNQLIPTEYWLGYEYSDTFYFLNPSKNNKYWANEIKVYRNSDGSYTIYDDDQLFTSTHVGTYEFDQDGFWVELYNDIINNWIKAPGTEIVEEVCEHENGSYYYIGATCAGYYFDFPSAEDVAPDYTGLTVEDFGGFDRLFYCSDCGSIVLGKGTDSEYITNEETDYEFFGRIVANTPHGPLPHSDEDEDGICDFCEKCFHPYLVEVKVGPTCREMHLDVPSIEDVDEDYEGLTIEELEGTKGIYYCPICGAYVIEFDPEGDYEIEYGSPGYSMIDDCISFDAIDHQDEDHNGLCDDCGAIICSHSGEVVPAYCSETCQGKWLSSPFDSAEELAEYSLMVCCDCGQIIIDTPNGRKTMTADDLLLYDVITAHEPVEHRYENGVCVYCGTPEGGSACQHEHTEERNKVTPTCGEDGYSGDLFCLDCQQTIGFGTVLPATGEHAGGTATCSSKAVCTACGQEYGGYDPDNHDYEIEYSWARDGSYCKATATCKNNPEHVVSGSGRITSEIKSEASCGVDGVTTYTATFNDPIFETQTIDIHDIPAKIHAWHYVKADNGIDIWCANCDQQYGITASTTTRGKCSDEPKEMTVTGTLPEGVHYNIAYSTDDGMAPKTEGTYTAYLYIVPDGITDNILAQLELPIIIYHNFATYAAVPATCLEPGHDQYVRCVGCGYTDYVEIPALGHDYEISYVWSEDGSSCTATRICKNDTTDVTVEEATITSKVSEKPTCVAMGTTLYTAAFTNKCFTAQTLEVTDIPCGGHDYGEPVFTWSADWSACTATFTCKNNAEHTETVDCTITKMVYPGPSDGEKNNTIEYTATAVLDGTEYTDVVSHTAISFFDISGNEVLKGDYLTWTFTTSTDVTWIKLATSYTAGGVTKNLTNLYKYTNATENISITDNNGVRTWTIRMKFTFTGDDVTSVRENWTVSYKVGADSTWYTIPSELGIDVVTLRTTETGTGSYGPYSLVSVTPEKNTADINTSIDLVIKTTADCDKIRVTVNGKNATYQKTSKNVTIDTESEPGFIIWTISYKITRSGENEYAVATRGPAWGEAKTFKVTGI